MSKRKTERDDAPTRLHARPPPVPRCQRCARRGRPGCDVRRPHASRSSRRTRRRRPVRRAVRPAPPPEPTVSQPPPLKDLKGKVAYITASSDGIGLGIARACLERGHEGRHRLSQRRAPEGRPAAVQGRQRGRARDQARRDGSRRLGEAARRDQRRSSATCTSS